MIGGSVGGTLQNWSNGVAALSTVVLRNQSMSVQQQNVVGAQVRKLRHERQLTQDVLAARCGALGWDISRATLSKVEARLRCVTDRELWYLATALRVSLETLYPASMKPPPKTRHHS